MAHDTSIIEWAPFRLAGGMTEDDLLKRSEELQEDFLRAQPGFLRRELLRGKDGGWVDLVYWSDADSAAAAMAAALASPVCHRYFGVMEPVQDLEGSVSHFQSIRSWK